MSERRAHLAIRGIVQGVGFRPFVHRLAQACSLSGFARNTAAGLEIEIEGAAENVARFLVDVREQAPPLAWVREVEMSELVPLHTEGFEIRASVNTTGEFALVSPDVATCEECRADFSDPANRRFEYAFTNCTSCGPRYTIIAGIPYDRPLTTMRGFRMCPACQAEYDSPASRRFHAQPNACPVCGPALSAPLEEARRRLAAGEIVAVKGLGGFHLVCDACNAQAVERLRERKRPSAKPFAMMARDAAAVEAICKVSGEERRALTSPRRPIVILERREDCLIPEAVAPRNRTLGVMLPYTPLHHLLFAGAPYSVLVMTSGNRSEEPIVTCGEEARERLGGIADWFLDHSRPIETRADDSVVRCIGGRERVLRRSRGYVPSTIEVAREMPELLATGGELKNAFCLTKGRHAILSQHIGDLENYETLLFFEETLAHLKRLFRVEPKAVAYDPHPLYLSTKWATERSGLPAVPVQHHHAHIAACMAENGLEGEVIGVALDGTGYGTDGTIWGGEFLRCGYAGFTRLLHFRPVVLGGGDAAVRDPWRSALAYVTDAAGEDAPVPGWDTPHVRAARKLAARGAGTVLTSSCGRLFDAVSALLGICRESTYEGQAAIELEAAIDGCARGRYRFAIAGESIDFRPAILEILAEQESGASAGEIAARFHNTVAAAIVESCCQLRERTGIDRVCLSGGTFQNLTLLTASELSLRDEGFAVYTHSWVPPNDGGIALGQAVVAAALMLS